MDFGAVGFHSKNQSSGYGFEGGGGGGVRGPFSPSQWMELEHQALIYKYITSNVPIPSYLLNPIRKAFQSAAAACYYTTVGIRSNPLAWGGLHLGYCSTDPEPGRCRRTDGKKWRCSREAVAEGKYCERHMNRGRHRSRKPVEGHQSGGANASSTVTTKPPLTPTAPSTSHHRQLKSSHPSGSNNQESSRNEFGLVFYDSLLNPLNKASSSLVANNNKSRQMCNDWPDVSLQLDGSTQLSISVPTKGNLDDGLKMGLGMGIGRVANKEPTTNWAPISWETAMGGPLGEVLHTGECSNGNVKPLNLMDSSWELRPAVAMGL